MRLLARRAHVSEPPSIKHLDLFSGIGGFALAADWTWPNVEHVFCEIDLLCQGLLKQHFPNSLIYGDIKELDGRQLGPIDLLTGGFPCQPFSLAGKRKGEADDRFLWPHMLRLISETKPRWVIGENVAGILSMGIEQVYADLESIGYETAPPLVLPAASVGAPHLRNRVWIIAYADTGRHRRYERSGLSQSPTARPLFQSNWLEIAAELRRADDGIPRRVDRFKALGNSIVPQVAAELMRAISAVDL